MVGDLTGPVLLVGHSYSGMVVGQVADRDPERVAGVVNLGSFLPEDGVSLMNVWGDTTKERAEEVRTIADDGNLWTAPNSEMLEMEPDLNEQHRDYLAHNFRDHPGLTVTDPAVMANSVQAQPTTYVALSAEGEQDAWVHAPQAAREATGWRRRFIASGHWPMVSRPEEVADLLGQEARYYARKHVAG